MLDVQMMPKNQSELYGRMFFSGVRVHSDGTFELPNVTPGEYTIIGWLYGEQVHSAQQDIEVGSTDVEGLTLVVGMGVNVRGTVVWEGKASIAKDGLMAAAIPATGEFGFGGALSALDKNSQFLWKDLSEGQFRIDVMGMGKDCYVKEIRMGENRMEGNVIRLNRSGGEVEITISSQGGKIQGTVLTSESLPLANAWAVAVAENSVAGKKAWAATTDQNGHYELQGLPPGKYKIYSWQDLEEGSWEDQDVLKEYEEKGERVELQSGEAKGMDLNLIPLKDGPKQPE